MKQSQWALALVVLVGMVFIVTFLMNFIGGGRAPAPVTVNVPVGRELHFFWKLAPIGTHGGMEAEEKSSGYQDFWFHNDNAESVKVGLDRVGCARCTTAELFLLPNASQTMLFAEAAALVGAGALGLVPVWSIHAGTLPEFQMLAGGKGHELAKGAESVDVPGNAVGWVRLKWTNEKAEPQRITAKLWIDVREGRDPVELETRLFFVEPLRVRNSIVIGVIGDEDLERGIRRDIICWSSTRPSLRLEVKCGEARENPDSDPFEVGKPEPLSRKEVFELEKENNTGNQDRSAPTVGRVLCAYRIPVTLRAVSRDGKTPFNLGPFSRHVSLSCPDLGNFEPKLVTIRGRVRGFIEVGNGEEGGSIYLATFRSSQGKHEATTLQSNVPNLSLKVDDARTAKFLKATVTPAKRGSTGGQSWDLKVEVPKDAAIGIFPRREDPRYEDSAIYLNAIIPGKPTRTIRIAVAGTANQG